MFKEQSEVEYPRVALFVYTPGGLKIYEILTTRGHSDRYRQGVHFPTVKIVTIIEKRLSYERRITYYSH